MLLLLARYTGWPLGSRKGRWEGWGQMPMTDFVRITWPRLLGSSSGAIQEAV